MKRANNFWLGLEKYVHKVVGRSPLPQTWPWIGVGIIILVMLISAISGGMSTTGETSLKGVIERAAELGDYALAGQLYEQCEASQCQSVADNVLGAESDLSSSEASLEEMVYPERVVVSQIAKLEEKLEEYPENKEIYLLLADWYSQIGNWERASEYWEKARVLDPNGVEFR